MRDGVLQQCDSPQGLYRNPVNLFVAAFIGSPAINLVRATIDADGIARFGSRSIAIPAHSRARRQGDVVLGIRPSDLVLSGTADASWPRIQGVVEVVEDLGPQQNAMFTLDAPRVKTDAVRAAEDHEDDRLLVDDCARFTATLDARNSVRVGETVEFAVCCDSLHAFDCDDGAALG